MKNNQIFQLNNNNQLIKTTMRNLIIFGIINLSISCGTPISSEAKTIKNDSHLKSINDSLLSNSEKIKNNISSIEKKEVKDLDTHIVFYQDLIDSTVSKMFDSKNIIINEAKLKELESDKNLTPQNKVYWKSYLLYYRSVFYKSIMNDDKKASEAIDLAIEPLETKAKTSEDFALLAMCKSFSIQFVNMTQLGKVGAEVNEYADKSLALNSKNLRAYYVLASHNYYTPKMFGGMIRVEEYSLKGLSCPISLDTDSYSPNWGKSKLYEILINYFEGEKRNDDAEKYKNLAKKEFPTQF